MLFSRFKKTNYKAGAFRTDPAPLSSSDNLCVVDLKFRAPRKIDNRDMCLSTDDQGNTPFCAGYTTAGYIEFQNWKKLNYPEHLDAIKIYETAKEIELNNYKGTTFHYTVESAKRLSMHNGSYKYVAPGIIDLKFAVHKYGVCMAGFMTTDEWNYVSTRTGEISKVSRPTNLGGHAVLIAGYDNNGVYIQNSWGSSWGIHGFAILSWEQYSKQIMHSVVIHY